jgi:hypothetical protein
MQNPKTRGVFLFVHTSLRQVLQVPCAMSHRLITRHISRMVSEAKHGGGFAGCGQFIYPLESRFFGRSRLLTLFSTSKGFSPKTAFARINGGGAGGLRRLRGNHRRRIDPLKAT